MTAETTLKRLMALVHETVPSPELMRAENASAMLGTCGRRYGPTLPERRSRVVQLCRDLAVELEQMAQQVEEINSLEGAVRELATPDAR